MVPLCIESKFSRYRNLIFLDGVKNRKLLIIQSDLFTYKMTYLRGKSDYILVWFCSFTYFHRIIDLNLINLYSLIGDLISESFSISKKMCQTNLSTVHLFREYYAQDLANCFGDRAKVKNVLRLNHLSLHISLFCSIL